MKKKLLILLFGFLSISSYSQKEEQTAFSLDEAIEYALVNNRRLENASRDIEIAEKLKWETIATGLPQLNANGSYQQALKKNVFVFDDQIIQAGSKHTITGTATISQLLFDGSYLVGLQSSKVYLEISKNAKDKTRAELRKQIIEAYGNTLLTLKSLEILDNNKKVLEGNLFETKKIYENGLTEEENVEQLEITLASLNNNIRNIKRIEIVAKQMLNFLLGKEINSTIKLTDTLENLTDKNIQLELLNASENVEETIDYKIAANENKSKELLVKLEKTKSLPSLNAFLNGGYSYNQENLKPFSSESRWFGNSFFGLNLSIPIFSSGMRSAATKRASIELEKSETMLQEVSQEIKLAIESAKSDYLLAVETYETSKQNLDLAKRIEKKNQTKYFEGLASSFDLRNAQTQLYRYQQEYLEAMVNIINTKANLEKILAN